MLHIKPSNERPTFVQVASLRITNQTSKIRLPLIYRNRAILSSDQSVLLWDYCKGEVACWSVPGPSAGEPQGVKVSNFQLHVSCGEA